MLCNVDALPREDSDVRDSSSDEDRDGELDGVIVRGEEDGEDLSCPPGGTVPGRLRNWA